jgi:signal transduction histidine kinase/CheY-like chemotaxis protein
MTTEQPKHYTDAELTNVFVGIFFSYLVTGYLGLHLPSVNTFAAFIWPPSGIALAAFLIYGYRVWPGVFFAAFLVNASVGAPLTVALLIALGNTIGPLAGMAFIRWYSGYSPASLRLRDYVGIIVAAFTVPLITATIGAGSALFGSALPLGSFEETWRTWWAGDALGILICTPFILKWFNRPLYRRTNLQYAELFISSATVAVTAYVIFWSSSRSFAYVLFIPLTWVALRTGPRGITLALLLGAAVAIPGTILGLGPFAQYGLSSLQIFLGTMSMMFLIFTAVVEERKNIRNTLERHVDELENALFRISAEDEAKKEFLAVLAHELRNPLATILSSIELIRMEGFSVTKANALLDTISERSHAMVHLLDDLLDISRISHKKFNLQKKVVAVDEFIDKLVLTTQPLIAKYGHTFTISRPEEELFVNADPVRLEQIFTNLVINAAKYTKNAGSIHIIVKREKEMVVTSIRDNGMGIPKNMLRRIFEPFFQVNRDENSKTGLGIGLPLTRQLVEMHGGTIEARSEGINAGSEFVVYLPLVKHMERGQEIAKPVRRASSRRTNKTPAKRTFKIFVVDDNREGADALARLLELRGHRTQTAYSGTEGLEKIPAFKPEVLLLDIGLPDMDGYEVATALKAMGVETFYVALTGYGQTEDKDRAKQAGFNEHLTKPAGLKEIEAVLKKIPEQA